MFKLFRKIITQFNTSKYLSSGLIYKEDKEKLLILEFIGIIFVVITSVILRFSYKWSSGAMWAIILGSVNNSVWENTKIILISYVFWGIIELMILLPPLRTFVVAKTITIYFLLTATITFYSLAYSNFTFIIKSLGTIIFIFTSSMISYYLISKTKMLFKVFDIAIVFLALFSIIYFLFTALPPQSKIFQDPLTGTYGIPKKTLLNEHYINAKRV